MRKWAKIVALSVAILLGLWAVLFVIIMMMHSPLDDCVEIGGVFVSESDSCICKIGDTFEVCRGPKSIYTDEFLEELNKKTNTVD